MLENYNEKLDNIRSLFHELESDEDVTALFKRIAIEKGYSYPPESKDDIYDFWMELLEAGRSDLESNTAIEEVVRKLDLVDQYNKVCDGKFKIFPIQFSIGKKKHDD